MWGFITGLFAGDNSTSIIDGIKSGADKLFFTDEEKADATKEGWKLWIEYQKATAPQNKSRRFIAKGVTLLWIMGVLLVAVTYPISKDYSAFIFKLMTDVVTIPFGLVISFYFLKRMSFTKEK